jgi:hypothetical protein
MMPPGDGGERSKVCGGTSPTELAYLTECPERENETSRRNRSSAVSPAAEGPWLFGFDFEGADRFRHPYWVKDLTDLFFAQQFLLASDFDDGAPRRHCFLRDLSGL